MSYLDTLLEVFLLSCQTIGAVLTELNLWMRGELRQFGMPHALLTAFPLTITILLVLGALRSLGGFVRVLVVLFLLAAAYHIALPAWQS